MAEGAALELSKVSCRFAAGERGREAYTAIRDVDLSVRAGEFVSIVGPTGCGKSTLLNTAAGLVHQQHRRIEDERLRQCHALAHAARHLVRVAMPMRRKADAAEPILRRLLRR